LVALEYNSGRFVGIVAVLDEELPLLGSTKTIM